MERIKNLWLEPIILSIEKSEGFSSFFFVNVAILSRHNSQFLLSYRRHFLFFPTRIERRIILGLLHLYKGIYGFN